MSKSRRLLFIVVAFVGAAVLLKSQLSVDSKALSRGSKKVESLLRPSKKIKIKLTDAEKKEINALKLDLKELFGSISKGEMGLLEKHLLGGGGVEHKFGDVRMSLLGKAAYSGNAEAVKMLLLSGADKTYVDELGNNPLMLSFLQDKNNLLYKELIDTQMDLDQKNHKGEDALFLAVQSFNYGALKEILSLKVSSKESLARAFLLSIDHQDKIQMSIFLEKEPALLRSEFDSKEGPVYWSCQNSKIQSLEFLLSKVGDPGNGFRGDLMSFAKSKSYKCLQFFTKS